jgi:hypothetical protein
MGSLCNKSQEIKCKAPEIRLIFIRDDFVFIRDKVLFIIPEMNQEMEYSEVRNSPKSIF